MSNKGNSSRIGEANVKRFSVIPLCSFFYRINVCINIILSFEIVFPARGDSMCQKQNCINIFTSISPSIRPSFNDKC